MTTEGNKEGLDKALEICDKLLQVAIDQRTAIMEENVGRLMEMVDERDRLVSSLDFQTTIIAQDGGVGTGRVDGKRSMIVQKIRELISIDEENKKVLQARLEEMKAQFSAIARGRQALHKYTYLKPQLQPIYVDKRR